MAKIVHTQAYPRIKDEKSKFHGYLDDEELAGHLKKISVKQLKSVIADAIIYASEKSSREILSIPDTTTSEELHKISLLSD